MIIHPEETHLFSKVSVIGLGYIGLPTAAALAAKKVKVVGVDINQNAIDTINRGEVHFLEPELDIIVRAVVSEGYLQATLKPEPANAFIIAVPTPFKDDHEPDLSYVEAATKSISAVLKKGDLVILESTSPVGTTEQMAQWLAEIRPDLTFPQTHNEDSDIRIAYCPERVLPGHVLHELVHNSRVVGGLTPRCSSMAVQLYKLFIEGECIVTNTRTAEMCKLTENSFRDVNIAFANELSILCDKLGINVWELIRLANYHPRVNILNPGPGVGGHCIPVDPWFIVNQFPDDARLIQTARLVNESKEDWVVEKVSVAVAAFLQNNPKKTARDVTIACLGMSFKPDVDDLRESPALCIIKKIAKIHPGHIFVVEPNVINLPLELTGVAELRTLKEVLVEADIILKLVNHKSFKDIANFYLDRHYVIDVCG